MANVNKPCRVNIMGQDFEVRKERLCTVVTKVGPHPKHHAITPREFDRVLYYPLGIRLISHVTVMGPEVALSVYGILRPNGTHKPLKKPIVVKAKCSPEDTFDLLVGQQICIERLNVEIAKMFMSRGESISESLRALPFM